MSRWLIPFVYIATIFEETKADQLIAEIGNVRRFPRRRSIVGFAGIDLGVDESESTELRASYYKTGITPSAQNPLSESLLPMIAPS